MPLRADGQWHFIYLYEVVMKQLHCYAPLLMGELTKRDHITQHHWETPANANIIRPAGWAFFVGLLQAAYTLTGYGMVAAMCEEVQHPEREVPKAMVLSVAAAGVTGVLFCKHLLIVCEGATDVLLQWYQYYLCCRTLKCFSVSAAVSQLPCSSKPSRVVPLVVSASCSSC